MLSALLSSIGFPVAYAEEKQEDDKSESEGSDKGGDEGSDDKESEEDSAPAAADDEDEEEPEDEAPAIQEDCQNKQCKTALHHFEECQSRVQEGHPKYGKNEDCVEEFFHLRHCVDNCAASKIFAKLK